MCDDRFYEIRVEGCLSANWTDWFEGLEIHNDGEGVTTLRGRLLDQAALFGTLSRIHALNLKLLSLQRTDPPQQVEGSLE